MNYRVEGLYSRKIMRELKSVKERCQIWKKVTEYVVVVKDREEWVASCVIGEIERQVGVQV